MSSGMCIPSSGGISGGAIMKMAPTRPSAPTQKVMASISTSRTMSIGEKPQLE